MDIFVLIVVPINLTMIETKMGTTIANGHYLLAGVISRYDPF